MTPSPHAAIIRISILLLVTCALAFGWEASRNTGFLHVTGHVVQVKNVFSGRGGDNKEFTILYNLQGKDYYLVTRRGILDSLGALRDLQRGDSVPVAARSNPPHRAILDTLSGRYGITLCFLVLAAVFGVVVAVMRLTGRLY